MPWRKYISAPYLKWPFWIIILVIWVTIFLSARYNGNLRWGVIVHETGDLSWYLLAFTLFLGLARKLCPKCVTIVRILPLRKHSGVLAFLIAGSHGIAELVKNGIHRDWEAIFNYTLSFDSLVTLGMLSFLLMLPLFLTSTEWAVKKMGAKTWFWLHKLAHPAFILAALHSAWVTGQLRSASLVWLVLYVLGYIILWIKRGIEKRQKGQKIHRFDPMEEIHE